MQHYPIRPAVRRELTEARLRAILEEIFEGVTPDGPGFRASYGALAALTVRLEGKDLVVETQMNPKVPIEVAQATIQRYNRFLETATGYTAKERSSKLKKAAHSAGPGATDGGGLLPAPSLLHRTRAPQVGRHPVLPRLRDPRHRVLARPPRPRRPGPARAPVRSVASGAVGKEVPSARSDASRASSFSRSCAARSGASGARSST